MAFKLINARNHLLKQEEDDFRLPNENIYLFDDFLKQFNKATSKLNKSRKKFIKLDYYLMNEILVFEVLHDCEIPLIEHENEKDGVFYFDNSLSFKAKKGYKFSWYFNNSNLFKDLIKKGLSYYKNRETTELDLHKKIKIRLDNIKYYWEND